ncbi:Vitamin B12 import ATP-binding protein BtuD [Streptomyces microflavus]
MASTTPIDTPPAPPAPPDRKERPKSTGRAGDKVFVGLSRGSGILLLVLMASIAVFLSYRAAIAISKDEGNFLTTFDWNPAGDPPVFGIAVLLFGTVVSSIIAMVIAVPIAVGIALFISHYAPRKLAAPIAYVVDLLAAVPSIVYGIWGALVLVPYLEGLNLWLDQFFGWTYIFEKTEVGVARSLFTVGVLLAITDRLRHDPDQRAAESSAGRPRRPVADAAISDLPKEAVISMAKRIDISGLSAFYGNHKAIEDISMTVEPRSVTAFIGPSGCGKSTFLRTLNRMHEVTPGGRVEGKVLLDDENLYASNVDPVTVRRTVGMVFQRPNPFPTMSIFDNVAAGLRLNGSYRKSELNDVVEKSLRGANLWNEVKDRLNKPGSGLSGGQQQRLCIARAIAVEPQVLLMDEPCSALDPISTLAIEDLIGELKERFTIVIVTHNMQQAARVSDRTAFFNLAAVGKPGRLIEIDETERIFSNPSVQATEDYISGRFG